VTTVAPKSVSTGTIASDVSQQRRFGWSKAQMLVATVARMGTGLATFIILARFLGPAPFGLIATAIAYSTFIGIMSDYGMASFALKNAGARPAVSGQIVADALITKALLAIGLAVVAAAVMFATRPAADAPVYILAFLGTIAASFADLSLVSVRAHNRFDIEAKLVVGASIVWMIAVGIAAVLTHDVRWCALAYGVSRIAYLAVCLFILRPWLAKGTTRATPRNGKRKAAVRATLKGASTYAADSMLTAVSTQIDVLILGLVLSLVDFGIYQAGARLVQSILPFAVVLSTVYLPRLALAAAENKQDVLKDLGRKVTAEFTILGVIAALGFAFVGPLVTHLIYGPAYAKLIPLWYGFGVFALLRVVGAGYGIQLVALGQIPIRIGSQIAAMLVFVVAVVFGLPHFGLAATSWMLALSALPVVAILGFGVARAAGDIRAVVISLSVTAVLTAALIIVASV
jgi:O-antigen/teichoic acid export membrane protein